MGGVPAMAGLNLSAKLGLGQERVEVAPFPEILELHIPSA